MALLLILIPFLQQCYGYIDDVPDPDFALKPPSYEQEISETGNSEIPVNESKQCNEKLSAHFKFLIKEILKKDVLTPSQRELFENAEDADPYSLSEEILTLIHCPSQTSPLPLSIYDYFSLVSMDNIASIAVIYITVTFSICYFSRKCRNFILVSHSVVVYFFAVYSRINKEYGDIKGKKLAAISHLPSHCKDEFSVLSYVSLVWSKLQIGDQCRRFHQEVLTDPLYEIQYLRCLVHPLVSLAALPLTVLGEELGPFLERVLLPFPAHLQIFLLLLIGAVIVFFVFSLRALATVNTSSQRSEACSNTLKSACAPDEQKSIEASQRPANESKKILEILREMQSQLAIQDKCAGHREVTDIMLLSESADDTVLIETQISNVNVAVNEE